MRLICTNEACVSKYLPSEGTFVAMLTVVNHVGADQDVTEAYAKMTLPSPDKLSYKCDACGWTASQIDDAAYRAAVGEYYSAGSELSLMGNASDMANSLSGRVAKQDVARLHTNDEALADVISVVEIMVRRGYSYDLVEPRMHLYVKRVFAKVVAGLAEEADTAPSYDSAWALACVGRVVVAELDPGVMAYTSVMYDKLWAAVCDCVERQASKWSIDPSVYLTYPKPEPRF